MYIIYIYIYTHMYIYPLSVLHDCHHVELVSPASRSSILLRIDASVTDFRGESPGHSSAMTSVQMPAPREQREQRGTVRPAKLFIGGLSRT